MLTSPVNKSTLARIPIKEIALLKTLLRSMIIEIISPAPITALRPAILVTMKSSIPRNGKTAAMIDQILLVTFSNIPAPYKSALQATKGL